MKFITQYKALQTNWLIGLLNKIIWILILISFGLIIFNWQNLPPEIPLWYAKPWGADRLASSNFLLLLPLGSLFWYLIDLFVVIYYTNEYLIFNQLLFISSFLVTLLSLISLAKIVFLAT